MFILRERVYVYLRTLEGQKERREGIPNRLCSASTEPNVGLDPTNHEVMT